LPLSADLSPTASWLQSGKNGRFADLPRLRVPTGKFVLQQVAAIAELGPA